ncbi:thiamine-phosphate kinase [Teichococcus oryzae]|uniref:Thiamine-monophosphate kinase n=1 Tax=Teichococcus oryzae TaxID=1608942 RepID=A0A5B2TFU1_9PROT|nr:thiamine-phosphate kinase [Pseudoroseomonas oryzae]KAA2212670.1 thiamine-phosphate kinase [Pseudoroseomonas oryzae]
MTLPPEFDLIDRHFRPLADPGALNLADDAALLRPPPGRELVLAADAMVENVHFLSDDPPETVGRKLLRTNLSDLAAMGAAPLGYLLTVALPRGYDAAWLAGFAAGLAMDQREFGLAILGGDTVSTTGPVSLSLTILGHVAPGTALRRDGAAAGQDLWVSGSIGDGALGLQARRGLVTDPGDYLAGRYQLPQPRLALGQALVGLATAAMDVSDGLAQDLGHLCRASRCGGVLKADAVPLSAAAASWLRSHPDGLPELLTGGDDYELLFAAPAGAAAEIARRAEACGTAVARIGHLVPGEPAVTLRDGAGAEIPLGRSGWSHF